MNKASKQLLHTLEQDFLVTPDPEFPHLFVEPDILVGGQGRLFALFVPRKVELTDTDRLLVRLAISRLGLPSSLICAVLIDRRRTDQKFIRAVEYHFEGLFSSGRNLADLRSFLKGYELRPQRRMPPEIRQQALERYGELYSANYKLLLSPERHRATMEPGDFINELKLVRGFEPVWGISWSKYDKQERLKSNRRSKKLMRIGDNIMAAQSFVGQSSPLGAIKPLCYAAVQLDYTLDSGIPYPHEQGLLNIMAVDEIPIGKVDPLKPIRAAAFAGWAFVPAGNAKDIDLLASKLRKTGGKYRR